MSMQKTMMEQSQRAKLAGQIQMSKEYAANDRQKNKLTMMEINARDEDRRGQMRLQHDLEKMGIRHFQLSDDRILEWNGERAAEGMSPWSMRDEGMVDVEDIPIDERLNLFHQGMNVIIKLRDQKANLGSESKMHGNVDANLEAQQDIVANLFSSLNNTEGLSAIAGLLEQFNMDQQTRGLPPLDLPGFLDFLGIKSSISSGGGGSGGDGNPFDLTQ
jgi:hypothetical protein